ncbi:MAG: ATP-binding protein [Melioribacteraceae bacterium]|nr:ATP-binding protein [Melioribacteraceae bacterium]
MEKQQLIEIVVEQRSIFEKNIKIVPRKIPNNAINSPKITVITGIRRCGKSTLLRQISKQYKEYNYINFEDERLLEFTYKDFNILLEAFFELQPEATTFFFDEIQDVIGWEKFARRLFTEQYKLYITGSSAKLLGSEIATSLTGRNIQIELYPFSFQEYLRYNGFNIKKIYTTRDKALIAKYLEEFLTYGGFPEVIKSKDYEELNQIYQDIIIKDLLVRLKIRDNKSFRELSLYLLSNISKKISYNNLKNLLQFSNTSKVKNYIEALIEAYLFFSIYKYDYSIKKQIRNDRKIYCIDQGIINATAFKFSKEDGRILENVVFLELKRRKKEIYYEEEKTECDFIIKKGIQITEVIQVTTSLANYGTKQREIKGLLYAMRKYKLNEGTIITKNYEDTLDIDGQKIYVVPLWKFLLENQDHS